MIYSTTLTQKGQMTVPKPVREALGLKFGEKVFVELDQETQKAKIIPPKDFLEIAKKIKPKRKVDPVQARELMEKSYGKA